MSSVPLTQAVTSGDASAVKAVLANGADVNERTGGGQTALILATIFGHTHLIPLLLDAGADPQLRDNLGLNAIDWAQRRGATEALAVLSHQRNRASQNTTDIRPPTSPSRSTPVEREVEQSTRVSEEERSRRWIEGLKQRIAEQSQRDVPDGPNIFRVHSVPPLESEPNFASAEREPQPEMPAEPAKPQPELPAQTPPPQPEIPAPPPDPQRDMPAEPNQPAPESPGEPREPDAYVEALALRAAREAAARKAAQKTVTPKAAQETTASRVTQQTSALTAAQEAAQPKIAHEAVTQRPPHETSALAAAQEAVQPKTVHEAVTQRPAHETDPKDAQEPQRRSNRKRCPKCNAVYNSDLLAYCAHHVVALVDEDAPIISEPPKSSSALFWIIIVITLTASVVAGSLVTSFFYSSQQEPPQVTAAQPAPVPVQKGTPVVDKQLEGKVVSLPVAEAPLKGQEAIPGIVVVRITVNKSGQVKAARASGGDWLLRGAASEAAMKSTFAPAKLRGRDTEGTITYTFGP